MPTSTVHIKYSDFKFMQGSLSEGESGHNGVVTSEISFQVYPLFYLDRDFVQQAVIIMSYKTTGRQLHLDLKIISTSKKGLLFYVKKITISN